MRLTRVLSSFAALAVIFVALGTPSPALAWSGCASSYYVQWGDTLGSVAGAYGTSVAALRQANPGLGYWLYAGQTLCIPGGYDDGGYGHDSYYPPAYSGGQDTYVVQRGDTMRKIAARYGVSLKALIAANPQIWNPNLIYRGQVVYIPGSYQGYDSYYPPPYSGSQDTYVVQWGDTMRKIAARYGVSLRALIAANPQIWNPNLIYRGQVVYIPGAY